jgi:hypothetical protein
MAIKITLPLRHVVPFDILATARRELLHFLIEGLR